MSAIYFRQFQHPVGQGGFHTGWMSNLKFFPQLNPLRGPVSFAWAYDCGSGQTAELYTEIAKVKGASFKVLFLSHLDNDHVFGVDNLLHNAKVEEVVLPYLNDTAWALHIAAAISEGRLTGTFLDLSADPGSWFGARGVDRVTYVGVSDEDDENPGEPDRIGPEDREPDKDPGLDDGRSERFEPLEKPEPIDIEWSREGEVLDPGQQGERSAVVLVARGTVAAFKASGQTIDWVLAPFAFQPSAVKLKLFEAKLGSEFPTCVTVKDYADQARTASGREKLRRCYDAVWKKHNLHSMALYAGPINQVAGRLRNTVWHGKFLQRIIHAGWISTGDFDMSVKKRRSAFLHYYSGFSTTVGQLSLPHHGSDLSFHPAILAAFPNLQVAIAAVGPNGYGHPGKQVQADIDALETIDFVRVDDGPSSVYEIHGPVGRL